MAEKNKRKRLGLNSPSLVQKNSSTMIELPLIIEGYKKLVQSDEIRLPDGRIIKMPQILAFIGPKTSTKFQLSEGERKHLVEKELEKRDKGKENTGKVVEQLTAALEPFDLLNPSRIYGAWDDWRNNRKGFFQSWREGNQGFGDWRLNLVTDIAGPALASKFLKFNKLIPNPNLGLRLESLLPIDMRLAMGNVSRGVGLPPASTITREEILPGFSNLMWTRNGDHISLPMSTLRHITTRTYEGESDIENLLKSISANRVIDVDLSLGLTILRGNVGDMEEMRDAYRTLLELSNPVWREGRDGYRFANLIPGRYTVVTLSPDGRYFLTNDVFENLKSNYHLTQEDMNELLEGLSLNRRPGITYMPEEDILEFRRRLLPRIRERNPAVLSELLPPSHERVTLQINNTPVQLANRAQVINPVKRTATRYIDKGEEPYKLEELVDVTIDANGNPTYTLKSGIRLDQARSGSHGLENWYGPFDSPNEKVLKYLNATRKVNFRDIKRIMEQNPRNRSGVLIDTQDHYSIDSFWTALKDLEANLKLGRKYIPLKGAPEYGMANPLGLKNRYIEEFSDELKQVLKNNKNDLPNDFKVIRNENGLEIFSPEGKSVGKLTTRSNEDIVKLYNDYIDHLNSTYNINIKHARVSPDNPKYIDWPEVYGLLYKKGGVINKFKTKMKFLKMFNNLNY